MKSDIEDIVGPLEDPVIEEYKYKEGEEESMHRVHAETVRCLKKSQEKEFKPLPGFSSLKELVI